MNRDEAIARIKQALQKRSGKTWSVTGGRGTACGWITIMSPPKRRGSFDYMTADDRTELAKLLGYDAPIHNQGVLVPASTDYRQEFVDRAEGREPRKIAVPYWD